MTEQEAILKIMFIRNGYRTLLNNDKETRRGKIIGKDIEGEWKSNTPLTEVYNAFIAACESAIMALEEIQQYRELGTVDEIKGKIDELKRWHTDHMNENIKNPFAQQSTLICHNCDHKDEYIEELEAEIEEYKSIGTVEECRAAVESRSRMKPIEYKDLYTHGCPRCKNILYVMDFGELLPMYCKICGQAIDWGGEE